jgi:hypothetical protein
MFEKIGLQNVTSTPTNTLTAKENISGSLPTVERANIPRSELSAANSDQAFLSQNSATSEIGAVSSSGLGRSLKGQELPPLEHKVHEHKLTELERFQRSIESEHQNLSQDGLDFRREVPKTPIERIKEAYENALEKLKHIFKPTSDNNPTDIPIPTPTKENWLKGLKNPADQVA